MLSLCNASKMFSDMCKCLRFGKGWSLVAMCHLLTHKNFSLSRLKMCTGETLHYILQILILCVHEYVFGCVYMCISVCFVTHVHQCYINWIWNLWEYNFIARLAVWLSLFCDKVLIIFLPHEIFIDIFHGSAF